jgi:hypothetical protein
MQKLFFLQMETKKTNSSINVFPCFVMLVQGKLTEQVIPKLVAGIYKEATNCGKPKLVLLLGHAKNLVGGKNKLVPLLAHGEQTNQWMQIFLHGNASN